MKFYKNTHIIFFLLFTALIGCSNNQHTMISGNAFGTVYFITLDDNKYDISNIKSNINNIIDFIDIAASNYNSNSEISKFNASHSTNNYLISSNLYNIISKANEVSDLTNGYFDISIGNINIAKGFNSNLNIKLDKSRNYNYKDIILSKNNLIKKKYYPMNLDLSGIAKGYAVDLIYDYLFSLGIKNFLINIGGEIKSYNESGPIIIGIDDPSNATQFIEEVTIQNKAIASSGTYIDTIEYNGEQISHIVNPKSSDNLKNLNLLVTVVHDECSIADALATGLIAMPLKDIIKFANKNKLAVLLAIKNNNSIEKYYSKEFRKYLYAE